MLHEIQVQKFAKIRHLCTVPQICRAKPYIFATKAFIDNQKKNW